MRIPNNRLLRKRILQLVTKGIDRAFSLHLKETRITTNGRHAAVTTLLLFFMFCSKVPSSVPLLCTLKNQGRLTANILSNIEETPRGSHKPLFFMLCSKIPSLQKLRYEKEQVLLVFGMAQRAIVVSGNSTPATDQTAYILHIRNSLDLTRYLLPYVSVASTTPSDTCKKVGEDDM